MTSLRNYGQGDTANTREATFSGSRRNSNPQPPGGTSSWSPYAGYEFEKSSSVADTNVSDKNIPNVNFQVRGHSQGGGPSSFNPFFHYGQGDYQNMYERDSIGAPKMQAVVAPSDFLSSRRLPAKARVENPYQETVATRTNAADVSTVKQTNMPLCYPQNDNQTCIRESNRRSSRGTLGDAGAMAMGIPLQTYETPQATLSQRSYESNSQGSNSTTSYANSDNFAQMNSSYQPNPSKGMILDNSPQTEARLNIIRKEQTPYSSIPQDRQPPEVIQNPWERNDEPLSSGRRRYAKQGQSVQNNIWNDQAPESERNLSQAPWSGNQNSEVSSITDIGAQGGASKPNTGRRLNPSIGRSQISFG